jgi:hypothetical protein
MLSRFILFAKIVTIDKPLYHGRRFSGRIDFPAIIRIGIILNTFF